MKVFPMLICDVFIFSSTGQGVTKYRDCRGRDHIVVRFTTIYAISTYHH